MKSMFHFLLCLTFILSACTAKKENLSKTPSKAESLSPSQLIEKGHSVYVANCLSCHGGDPRVDGPVGPSLAGSSEELLRLRVLQLKYPEGYKPKRNSGSMVAMPWLEADIPALHAYLNSWASAPDSAPGSSLNSH